MPVFNYHCDACPRDEVGVFVFSVDERVFCPNCERPMARKFSPTTGCIPSQAARMAIHQDGKHGHWLESKAGEIDKKLSTGEYSMISREELIES